MVREATQEDIDQVLEYSTKFLQAFKCPVNLDKHATRVWLERLIASPNGVVLMTERGAFGAIAQPKYYDPKDTAAIELFMYAEDGRGLEQIKAFEGWARKQGASTTVLANFPTKRAQTLEALYRRRGYRLMETAYARPIAG